MPITPLHFGINGTIASTSPLKIDIVSCILANVLLDTQPFLVLFFGINLKLHGISHTLLFAIIAGVIFFAPYGLLIKKLFHTKKPLSTFIFGGVIGGILHIVLDSFYHEDVYLFYPFSKINFAHLNLANEIVLLCFIGYITFIFTLIIRFYFNKVRRV